MQTNYGDHLHCIKLLKHIETLYPIDNQGPKDNSGLQLGNPSRKIKKIGVSYEKTLDVIRYCVENDIDLLITHRPLSIPKKYGPPPEIWWTKFLDVIKDNKLIIYSIHENFDLSKKGTGYYLAQLMGLQITEQHGQYIFGSIDTMPFKHLIDKIKHYLKPAYIFSQGIIDSEVSIIGMVAGTAMEVSDIDFIYSRSVDCYISGDMDDFGIRYARDLNIKTINVDDYSLEKPGLLQLTKLIENSFKHLTIEYIDCKLLSE